MDPLKAYESKRNYRKKVNILLFIFLLIQIILFITLNTGIKCPKFLVINLLKSSSQSKNVKIGDVNFKLPNSINLNTIEFCDDSIGINMTINNVAIKLNTLLPNSWRSFDEIRVKKIKLNQKENHKKIEINNFIGYATGENLNVSFNFNTGFYTNSVKGTINCDYLEEWFEIRKGKGFVNNLSNQLVRILEIYSNELLEYGSNIQFSCIFTIDKDSFIRIAQHPTTNDSLVNELNIFCKFDLINKKLNSLFTNIGSVKFPFHRSNFEINKIRFSILNKKIDAKNFYENYFADFNFQNITSKGYINSVIPNIYFCTSKINNFFEFTIISDSNFTKCTNIVILNPLNNEFSINGKNEIIPKFLKYEIGNDQNNTQLIDGDLLNIDLFSPYKPFSEKNRNNIEIEAKSLSILGSLPGEYNATGYFKADKTLYLNDISGMLGHSFVNGSFMQEWNPLKFEFILNGNCFPTDINNWLGEWWDKIWVDFLFDHENIPFGQFRISGIWNQSSNLHTHGIIDSQNFSYKGLPVENTIINLLVDENITSISTSSIKHNSGSIGGKISIPRKLKNDTNPIKYSLSGIYPINSGSKSLGPLIETYLDDFNLSSLSLNTYGEIFQSTSENNNSKQSTNNYYIDFSTDQKGIWNGINFDSFKGIIKAESDKLYFSFPSIKTCNGQLSLNLNSDLLNNDVNFNLSINNANIVKLYNSIISYQSNVGKDFIPKDNSFSISEKGVIDFSLNASGIPNDLMSFNGTGSLKIQDKELSKIRLLGFISDNLKALPLPFPTGTLNFNTLSGLFELQNGKLSFDNLVLSGVLSKVENKGSINLENGELDIISKIHLVGNFPIPIISQIAKITDPLSIFTEIKITGSWINPQWEILLNPLK